MFEGEEVALVKEGKISGSADSLGITVVHEGEKGAGCVWGGGIPLTKWLCPS